MIRTINPYTKKLQAQRAQMVKVMLVDKQPEFNELLELFKRAPLAKGTPERARFNEICDLLNERGFNDNAIDAALNAASKP